MSKLDYDIYLIEAFGTGFYKIGFANNLGNRFAALQQKFQPIELKLIHTTKCCIAYPGAMETRFHQWFLHKHIAWADKRLRSECEWFVLGPADVEFFKSCDEATYRERMPAVEHLLVRGVDPFQGESVAWFSKRFENTD